MKNHLTLSNTIKGKIDINQTATTHSLNSWFEPELINTEVFNDRIELLFKQISNISYMTFPSSQPEPRIYKIVYSCIDGKWNQSEPIYGKLIPASEEYYEFED